MYIYKTIQTFAVTYEVKEEENQRFLDMLDNEEDISDYEVEQEFVGETIVHAERD
jgi:hypothetical protein